MVAKLSGGGSSNDGGKEEAAAADSFGGGTADFRVPQLAPLRSAGGQAGAGAGWAAPASPRAHQQPLPAQRQVAVSRVSKGGSGPVAALREGSPTAPDTPVEASPSRAMLPAHPAALQRQAQRSGLGDIAEDSGL